MFTLSGRHAGSEGLLWRYGCNEFTLYTIELKVAPTHSNIWSVDLSSILMYIYIACFSWSIISLFLSPSLFLFQCHALRKYLRKHFITDNVIEYSWLLLIDRSIWFLQALIYDKPPAANREHDCKRGIRTAEFYLLLLLIIKQIQVHLYQKAFGRKQHFIYHYK